LTNGHLLLLMKDATQGVTANFNLTYLELPKAPELFLPPSLRQRARPGGNGGTQSAMNPGSSHPGAGAMPPPQNAGPSVQH